MMCYSLGMQNVLRIPDRSYPSQVAEVDRLPALEQTQIDLSSLRAIGEGRYLLEVPWNEALSCWKRLREQTEYTGLYPLLLESRTEFEGHLKRSKAYGISQTLEEGRTLDPAQILARRLEKVAQAHSLEEFPPQGEWPDEDFDSAEEYYYTLHYRYEPAPITMLIGLVPTFNPWEAPTLLGFSGPNGCPTPAEHSSVLRSWFERYGAEPIIVTRDVLELRVVRPPLSPEAALELAQQQFAYCDDIVYQGTGTLEALAGTLVGTPTWYFWWN